MTIALGARPRLLLIEPDETWRERLSEHLGGAGGTGATASVEEAIGWLEGRVPGVTLLSVEEEDPLTEVAVTRILELYPSEVVVVASDEPTVELCRRAMRVGAFDVVARAHCLGHALDRTLAEASHRLASAQSRRRRRYDMVREAVARHERHASAQLLEGHAISGAWSKIDPTLRRSWISAYLRAASGDTAEHTAFVREMSEEIAALESPPAVAIALHVQAVMTGHTGWSADVPPSSRNLCIDLLAALAERGSTVGPGVEAQAAAAGLWHRWRMDGQEYWWLVLDGRLRAQVRVTAAGTDGSWLAEAEGTVLRSSPLPGLPEALREIERRVDCPYILDVAPAESI